MKILVQLVFISCMYACSVQTDSGPVGSTNHDSSGFYSLFSPSTTRFVLVRHAEKDTVANDPELSLAGHQRARYLSELFAAIPVHATFTTPYKRTRQTLEPLAQAKNLAIQTYAHTQYGPFIDTLLSTYPGKTILLAGHSNTLPAFLNAFDTSFHIQIADRQYDRMFIVAIDSARNTRLMEVRYGQPTP